MKLGWMFRALQRMSEFVLDKADRGVWDILRRKLVNVVCKVFSGRPNFVDRELMRGKMRGFRT